MVNGSKVDHTTYFKFRHKKFQNFIKSFDVFWITNALETFNKPGPAQVGATSKAQNSKRTSKCQSFGDLGTFNEKNDKKSQNAEKKTKRRTLCHFSTSILLQISKQNLKGDSLVEKN